MAKEPAEKKKKKAKSVSFTGDTTLDDVQWCFTLSINDIFINKLTWTQSPTNT